MSRRNTSITVKVVGEISNEFKRKYARTLARNLVAKYGKENCKKILEELKIRK